MVSWIFVDIISGNGLLSDGTKPSPETSCHLDPQVQTSKKLNHNVTLSCLRKWHLQYGSHFVLSFMCQSCWYLLPYQCKRSTFGHHCACRWPSTQGWGQFRFCNSNSNSNSGISRFYNSNSNSNSRAYNSNSNSNSRSSIPIPIPIPVTRWNQYAASIHIDIIIARLMVQYGENTNNVMNKTHRE